MARKRVMAAVLAVLIPAWNPDPARASGAEACEIAPAAAQSHGLKLTAGVEATRVWVTAEYEGLRIRKFTAKGGASVAEFTYGDDTIVVSLSKQRASVGRNGVARDVAGVQSVEHVYQLLGGSPALFQTRRMLSQLERASALKAGSMSVLSAAAFLVSLTGDVEAPLRLSERFVEKHRSGFRRVRLDDEATCWEVYSKEVDNALSDAQQCTKEALETGGLWVLGRAYACSATWALRVESAWFEYLKCLSPLGSVAKVE